MRNLFYRIRQRIRRELVLYQNHFRVVSTRNSINYPSEETKVPPVVLFNASTRLSGLSQNAGFSLITGLALHAEGIPVIHLVCKRGLSHCILGTDKDHPHTPPPCAECVRTSDLIFDPSDVRHFKFSLDIKIQHELSNFSLPELLDYSLDGFPIGPLILPSLRWILRRHHLKDDEDTRYLAREYILSAWNLKNYFECLISDIKPRAVVVFNGMTYPEAVVRWVAGQNNIPVFSHEVGMQPLSAFFTDQEATAYPVRIDETFQLSEDQNKKLDDYLQRRFEGKFITAGIKFWPQMKSLDEEFLKKAASFKAIVPVFTNVVFDTSQSHANVVFNHMFEWLDMVFEKIKKHSDVLFVIRAHPDELRPGKESRETVEDWMKTKAAEKLQNLVFIPPKKFISSYDLIDRSKFVMVYNSTIGLEASIIGRPVLCAGRARYTQIPTVYFPQSRDEYQKTLNEFLKRDFIEQPEEFRLNARRVLYSQLFRASLPFEQFLEDDGVWQGYVRVKKISPQDLAPEKSSTIQVVMDGILKQQPFIKDL